jgi:hypothetical protein
MTPNSKRTPSMTRDHVPVQPRRANVPRRLWRLLATLIVALAATTAAASPASAAFDVLGFDGSIRQQDGTAATQAGSHPFAITTKFSFPTSIVNGAEVVDESVKTIKVSLPVGLVGDPTAVDTCTTTQLGSDPGTGRGCPLSTQVGTINIGAVMMGFPFPLAQPIYNMVPPPGVPAQFGFNVTGALVHMNARVRTGGDYGLDIELADISQGLALKSNTVTFWGVPNDPAHDPLRGYCLGFDGNSTGSSCPSGRPARPFLALPSACSGPLTFGVKATSWTHPDAVKTSSFSFRDEHDEPVGIDGCERVPFRPEMTVAPTTDRAGSPTGLAIDLTTPQNDNPAGLAQATLRKAVVTMPKGFTINAASASGLAGCAPAEVDLQGAGAARCPEASKIGTVAIDTPLVDHPLEGGIFLAKQADNPFGSLLALYLAVDDPQTGIVIKLAGKLVADPVSGQVTATFEDTPQLPFETMRLRFKSGSRGVMTTPATCGTYTTHAELTPWSSPVPVAVDAAMQVTDGCADGSGFTPSLMAGTTSTEAGGSPSFVLDVTRPSGQQDMSGLDVTLPAGLLGRVGDVPRCAEADAAAGTCAPASRIGSTTVSAGPGTTPVVVPQPGRAPTAVYLAGPYKGAPYSLSIVVPAQAGPFDLGTVVVRAAVYIDPIDAHVAVKVDPLPTILQGIPLQVQRINVTLDRSRFMVNPTSCAPKAITADVRSVTGTQASLSNRFQVGDCASLGLTPKLALSLSGKGETVDGKHPAVSALLTQPAGQANLKKVRVALPLSLALDTDNANGLCEFVDGSKVTPTCPKSSIVGTATAVTPILNEPLSGPVYFVKNVRKNPKTGQDVKTLPKLVIPLVGENGLKLTLTGTSDVEDDHLVTTFDNVPDAPVSSFQLNINGGKGGILAVSGADICKSAQIAEQQVDGQSSKAADADVYIQTPSCPTKVISKKITAKAVVLKVGGLGAGKVTVSGRGIKRTTKAIAKSTVATITAKRTKERLGKVKVSFVPAGSEKAKTTTVTLR